MKGFGAIDDMVTHMGNNTLGSATMTYRTLAEAIRSLDPASVPVEGRDDVLLLMEHLQRHQVARHDAQERREEQLSSREQALVRQELELRQALRAASLARLSSPGRRGWRAYLPW